MATNGDKIKNLDQWKGKFLKEHVQDLKAIDGGDFLSSETVALVSGPPIFDSTKITELVPIGLVQNVQVQQQKNLQQIFEVGSRRPYFIPGRTFVSSGISRILFDGPSLMYSMYMKGADSSGELKAFTQNGKWDPVALTRPSADKPTLPITKEGLSAPVLEETTTVPNTSNPGLFFSNLASSFFNYPTGLGFILYDQELEPYGGFYLEECYLVSHTISIASQQTILMENVSIRSSFVIPLEVKDLT